MTEPAIDFQTAFNALPGNFFILKPDAPNYTILAVSDELLRITGRKRQAVAGKSIFDVYPENPEAITTTGPSALRTSIQNAVQHKKYDQMPGARYDLTAAPGAFEERYWSACNKPVLDMEGEVAYIIHSVTDITELELAKKIADENEQKLGSLLKASPFPIAVYSGREMRIEMANQAMIAAYGKGQDVVGRLYSDVLPEMPPEVYRRLEEVFTTGVPFHSLNEFIEVVTDGKPKTFCYNYNFTPLFDAQGKVYGIMNTAADVTELNLAHKKIEESEKTLKNIFARAPVAVAVFMGPDFIIEQANEKVLEYWGRSLGQVINKPLFEALPEAAGQGLEELLSEVLTTGKPFVAKERSVELERNNKLERTYVNFVYEPCRNTDGSISGVVVVASEITEQVTARKKIEESESRFRHLVKQAPVAITFTRGRDVVIETINTPMLQIMGKERKEEVHGKSLAEVLPEMEGQQIMKIARQVYDSGKAFRGPEVAVNLQRAGEPEERYFNISCTPLTEEGDVTGIIHVAVDVTEQVIARQKIEESQEALRRFKFMADQARDAFVLMREDGTFAYLNQKAMEDWGYSEEETRHIRVPDVDPVYQEEQFSGLFKKAQNETIPQFETLHRRKDGEILPVEVNVVGLNLDGETYLFAVSRNIKDRKKAEETLKLNNEQLLRINNDLDNFIYTASHDLKAPITNIEGLVQLLLRNLPAEIPKPERVQQITGMMQVSVERFKKTIESLTDVVKLRKEYSGEVVSVDLGAVVKEVQLDLEPMIRESDVQIDIDIPHCHSVRFPEKNLRSVVYNLLSNAIKYRSAERKLRVGISCETTSEHDVLVVKDNGVGIRKRSQDQLFTMFKRFHTHVDGAGIGLYMVKKMVENAGGHIEVESQEGEGTTFRVYFPQ